MSIFILISTFFISLCLVTLFFSVKYFQYLINRWWPASILFAFTLAFMIWHIKFKGLKLSPLLILSSFFIFLCLLTILLSYKYFERPKQWWMTSIILSILCGIELFALWHYVIVNGLEYRKHHIVIDSNSILQKELRSFDPKFLTIPPIPTGIFIEDARFTRHDNEVYPGLQINGYIWQRYTLGAHDGIQRGFLMPNAFGQLNLKQLFNKKDAQEEILCWAFSAVIIQSFALEKFPFDQRHITIGLQHADFQKNVILVPDLKDYLTLIPEAMPGIMHQIPSWSIEESFFSYELKNFDTTFGFNQFISKNFPQLFYYIITRRNIISSALMHIILLMVAAVILFISLLGGFSTLALLGICSGLLFVLITSHMGLRSSISIQGTAYLEYIYMLLYAMILLIDINSVILARNKDNKLIQYGNNLIIKIAYWPILLFSIVVLSFFKLVL
jgi:hypothetical protein